MPELKVSKRPSFLWWSEIDKWTSTSGLLRFGRLPQSWRLVQVSDFATLIDNKERVEPDKKYQMAGVKWYGEGIFRRETVKGKEQSANYLYPLKPKAIIYNRLFAWKESFAVVPEEFTDLYVSNEFPQFEIDNHIALPEYIYLLFTSKKVIKAVNAASVGSAAVSRNRLKESDFLNFKVPIPPLYVQQKIVKHWDKMQKKIEDIKACIEDAKEIAFERFRESLGLSVGGNPKKPKFFAAYWSTIGTGRWGVDLVWRDKTQITVLAYPTKPLKSICKVGSGGTPSRKNNDYFGGNIPWVKTAEVRNRVIEDTEEKITSKGLASSSAKIYPAGSLVIAMYGQGATRGRTAKLGVGAATNQACLVLTDIDDSLDVDFLWYYLMASYEEMRQLASGNNQPNLSAELLGSFPIPIPSPVVQKDLKGIYENAQVEIENLKSRKKYLVQQTTEEIEKLILGTLSVEEI